ncbi:uncharacterized protein [Physcomitrium patens]|uniref:Uncharacterized protein n=1 Tax=Physcomitrium patens TaxID=3218 RepID=A0A2K1IXJ5_PHYPA|nr:hypothetical protein PHYPA_023812 [Physcomitrium patens]
MYVSSDPYPHPLPRPARMIVQQQHLPRSSLFLRSGIITITLPTSRALLVHHPIVLPSVTCIRFGSVPGEIVIERGTS